ncbi:class I SAM-dependent methyltransferase [Agrobacterium sp. AGB01]|uniref:class I SAM-dependent methyltransferase n=1 Tax=Agrobacterium sp. AGB01 TaxID=2769302 RepID=UPI00177F8614|nr:class I SAM-dependent methyltransferase [Agrobacterium sp. AGB01]MBD9388229.1 class I SAM-dependent methyltransferase [Agrobacterium sp. AGB01]
MTAVLTRSENHQDLAHDYHHAKPNRSLTYLLPAILKGLEKNRSVRRIFEIGCGTGDLANLLTRKGYHVLASDPSTSAIASARLRFPEQSFEEASAYDDLSARFGSWDAVVSTEVIEHLYRPKIFAQTAFHLLASNGTLIISTPYHGYWKNLALALSGKMDDHFMALRDHGHIKFWSEKTITKLLSDAGFNSIEISRAGRIPALAKSMVIVARKP